MKSFEEMNTFQLDVRRRLAASFGGLKIASRDAPTVLRQLRDAVPEDDALLTWSVARGTWKIQTDHKELPVNKDETDPIERALNLRTFFKDCGDTRTVLVLFDYDVFIKEDPIVRRNVVEAVQTARTYGHLLVLLSRHHDLHDELVDEMQLLVHELPSRDALRTVVTDVLARDDDTDHDVEGDVEGLLDVLGGLTSTRAADAVSIGVVDAMMRQDNGIDLDVVRAFKEKEIARMPGLDLVKTSRTFDDVVGLDALKSYLRKQKHSLHPDAASHGVELPKGVMLVGEPGTGKSVTPESFAHEAGWLMFKLDPGSLRGKYVGDTEANTDEALSVISANTPCVVLVDEVERFFSTSEGEHDGGVGERLTGKLLSWAAEQKGAFLIFTSNNPDKLPAQLVRKGRLDRFFHVGTPDKEQREAIWRYYLDKAQHHIEESDIAAFVEQSKDWVGSEIEAVVGQARKAAWASFCEDERDDPYPTVDDVKVEVESTIPHAVTYADQVKRMKQWAKDNADDANSKTNTVASRNKPKRSRRISV